MVPTLLKVYDVNGRNDDSATFEVTKHCDLSYLNTLSHYLQLQCLVHFNIAAFLKVIKYDHITKFVRIISFITKHLFELKSR